MAKKDKLSSNPAEAARKAARQKEIKKNKASREQAREFTLVKKDTRSLEEELRNLERTKADAREIERARDELKKIREAKDKYLKQHPEHRKLIYPHQEAAQAAAQAALPTGLFRPDGKPYHPERSLYYDPIYNPWGNPPPGMPYREKPPHEWASSSAAMPPPPMFDQPMSLPGVNDAYTGNESEDEDDEEDDGIVMPAGPPPSGEKSSQNFDESSSSDDDDDDIVMPSGPPPAQTLFPPPPPGGYTGPPPGFASTVAPPQNGMPYAPGFSPAFGPLGPLPPPVGFAPSPMRPWQARPPQSQGFYNARPPPNTPRGPANSSQRPRPPASNPAAASVVVEAQPTRTAANASSAGKEAIAGAGKATISSAPVLRDFKKEATTFLPSSVRKHKVKEQRRSQVAGLGAKAIRANPEIVDEGEVAEEDGDIIENELPDEASLEQPTADEMEEADEDERTDPASLAYGDAAVTEKVERFTAAPAKAEPTGGGAGAMGGLLAYYSDSDDEDGSEDANESAPVVSFSQHATLPPPTSDSQPQGRINLVEALAQAPWAQKGAGTAKQPSKSAATEEYERYLASVGDLLQDDREQESK